MTQKHLTKHSFTVRKLNAFDPDLEAYTFPHWRPVFRSLGSNREGLEPAFALAAVSRDGEKVGLLLGRLEGGSKRRAVFLSVYVAPPWRGQGVGRALWATAEELARKEGAEWAEANYVLGKPSIAFLEKILKKQEWSVPRLHMYVVKFDLETVGDVPWLRNRRLPEDYEIVLWRDLPKVALDELISSNAEKAWVPPDLSPAEFLENYHEQTSVALKWQGKIRGWLITHQLNGVLRWSCGFVHPDLQRRGRMFALYGHVAQRAKRLGLQEITCTVALHHPDMAAFAVRWLKPVVKRFSESRIAEKRLREE
ncbi:MAG: GNAT family N-acetyltransferase [Opitutales bacterium]|nr:GNAT family N-acetyltransferase [Opitutales bacterium]MCH8539650.1 GNAT family N-acetyltransferase [Opitutales bacterium]